MKRLTLLALLILLALPARAQDFPLRGQWQVRNTHIDYIGVVLIDGERRATWDSPSDNGRPAKFVGYVAEATDANVTLVLTDKIGVAKAYCEVRSSDLLHCYAILTRGTKSGNFLLVRVGPGPKRLTRPSL